jgi:hypothetical protein
MKLFRLSLTGRRLSRAIGPHTRGRGPLEERGQLLLLDREIRFLDVRGPCAVDREAGSAAWQPPAKMFLRHEVLRFELPGTYLYGFAPLCSNGGLLITQAGPVGRDV